MSAPKAVLDLIEHFERNLDEFKSRYSEEHLRLQFLNPLFEALGWDVYNRSQTAEAYKDVIHEDALRIGSGLKAPDYCFRIGGTRKFFLEAKKPSVFIKEEISAAYQLRRYAWTAKLPLSILSDFEEFAIYDCRIKPRANDKASIGRVFYCTFRELPEKWDYIAAIFSKDAVLKGSFDKYAAENKAKRGTAEVDTDFLEEIERWRKELAQNLALRNPKLTQRELNFAVQRIIDRVIFLRIAEDRGLETYGRLQALTNGSRTYLDQTKIIFPDICKGPRFCLDSCGIYLSNTAYCLGTDDLYLLGFLNSRLFWFAIANISIPFGIRAGQYRYRLIYQYMEKVPVRVINMAKAAEKAKHDRIVELVSSTLDLHRQRATARTPQEQTGLDRQIQSSDYEINHLVYELYGLTKEEIAVVEDADQIVAQAEMSELPAKLESSETVIPSELSNGKSTAQSEGDAAHYYSFKEQPPQNS